MRTIISITILSVTSLILMSACGSDSSVNVNVNRMESKAANAINTAVNTAANAIDKATVASPEDFLKELATGNMSEVEMGKLAASKATDPEIKRFGQQMVSDHTRVNNELKELAKKKAVELPADLGSKKSDVDDLKGLSGAEFDEEYVEQMLDDHRADVEAVENQSKYSTDADVKAFAAKILPTLKGHLETIEAIQKKMSNKDTSNSNNKK